MPINLFSILQLMNGGQTPQANDVLGYTRAANDGTDPSGTEYNSGSILDSQGHVVTDKDRLNSFTQAEKGGYVNMPYKPIKGLAATFNPSAANYVSEQNANYQLAPQLASHARGVERGVKQLDLDTLPQGMIPAGIDPEAAKTLYPNFTANTLEGENRAIANIRAGNPESSAALTSADTAAMIQNAKNNLVKAQFEGTQLPTTTGTAANVNRLQNIESVGALNRQSVVDATKDQQVVNELSMATKVEPMKIQAVMNNLRGELNRNPTYQEIQNAVLDTQLNEAKLGQQMSKTKLDLAPYQTKTLGNEIVGNAFQSQFINPSGTPFATKVNSDLGTVTPGVRVPGYMNPMLMKMEGVKTLNGPKDDTTGFAKLSNGTSVKIPQSYDARTGGAIDSRTSVPSVGGTPSIEQMKLNPTRVSESGPQRSVLPLTGGSNLDKLRAAQANPEYQKQNAFWANPGSWLSGLGAERDKAFYNQGKAPEQAASQGHHWEQVNGRWVEVKD